MKIAVVCSGGGMRCAYSAGVLYALATSYGFKSPDTMIAVSGSAGSATCYLAGGYEEMKTIWTELLSTPKFISWWRFWRIIDINYLVDEVLKRQLPEGVRMLAKTSTHYFIPVMKTSNKTRRYISNSDNIDIFETLRAAKALPVFFGDTVTLEGEGYIDGGVGLRLEEIVLKAESLGATHIIRIDNRASVREMLRFQKTVVSKRNIVLISNTELSVGRLTRNKVHLNKAFTLGMQDALNNKALQELLHKSQNVTQML